ncbi:rhamnulokinase [Caldalkalibacillus salinus]|uniref:rhamnulokinase n=1 Tax=Caldalkalibacillus salinus TaxID=2803787 RepID=UPI001923C3DF
MSVLAFDLGASSGRALIGEIQGDQLVIEEIHRFSNDPVQVGNRLHWDILRLYHEIKQGIVKAKWRGEELDSIAIDSWAVDFGLLDASGELLCNPYHYRDHHTNGVMEEVHAQLGKQKIFAQTGIQFLPFNTIYQLVAMKNAQASVLSSADALLMIPDLLRYFLTGERKSEFTNATTTQLFNPTTMDWDDDLLKALDLPVHLFGEVVQPGTVVGTLHEAVCQELDVPATPVIATTEHDTAAAVAGVPAHDQDFAYLSCGTWSLMGTEVDTPVLNEQALEWNFTNEGGVGDTYRLLKNIMGLWIVQECKRAWEKEGAKLSYTELMEQAKGAPAFQAFIDPDDLQFLNPSHMPKQIEQYCQQTNQQTPQTKGHMIRIVLESLALKYRFVLERTEQLSHKHFSGLHVVGGGINNTLLCQFTANAIARPVWAGPTEASGIGNVVVQYIALGKLKDIHEARALIRRSIPIQTYEPRETATWHQAYETFCDMIKVKYTMSDYG